MRVALLALLLLLMLHSAGAASVDVYVDLGSDGSVHEEFIYTFSLPYNQSFGHLMDGEIENVSVTSDGPGVPFTIENGTGGLMLNVMPRGPVERINISFVRKDKIFSNEEAMRFVTTLSLNRNIVRNLSVWVGLPPGYGINEGGYVPLSGIITSDGRRIVVIWKNLLFDDPQVFSVTYIPLVEPSSRSSLWVFIGGSLLIVLITLLLGGAYYTRRRERNLILVGFRPDERKALVYIRKKKVVFQRDLQEEFKFSRAKCTRITKRFERRNLIEKKGEGRMKKLVWKG
jgi:uncharacterized membrane protein